MKLHPEEVEFARLYTQYLHSRSLPFQGLTPQQSKAIIRRGRDLYKWFKAHQWLHNIISLCVIAFLFLADFSVLLWLPKLFHSAPHSDTPGAFIAGIITVGVLRGWIMYSIVLYSMHEGAAHNLIFRPRGPITRPLCVIANNLCRLVGGDPAHYAGDHRSHHVYFGTGGDQEFLSFVIPRRYWLTLIPFAMFINFSDFIVHRPLGYTRSRLLSIVFILAYNIPLFYFMARLHGLLFTILAMALISPHVAFQLDRVNHFSQHNLMPVEQKDGARSFGPGFWGLLIGGGPWGQPCHWVHHLVPAIPWYQQIILHRDVAKLLTPQQHKQYLLQPVVGFPKLLWQLWTEPSRFMHGLKSGEVPAAPATLDAVISE